mmetsp:Transcript_21732/g.30455  ORF Transcript_21732/g.30455 Transcript_21732/m.30455 type:complete len:124 (-) Transcript_21732:325-696(-)
MFGSNLSRITRHVNKIREMKVGLENVKVVQVCSHSHRKEATGIQKFVKDYLPALKFHNTEIAFTNVNKKETDPTLELHFEDGVVQKLDCSNISKDQVLEDLLKADKNFKAKEKVEFFGKEISI